MKVEAAQPQSGLSWHFINSHLAGEAFTLTARPGAPGALLVHGFTATTAEMRLLGDFLHRQGWNVSAPLLPGHGLTPQDLNRCHRQDWLQAVEAAYQALRQVSPSVAVCGESLGGLLSLRLAAEHPEIAAVVLLSPALRFRAAWVSLLLFLASLVTPLVHKPQGSPSPSDGRWQGYDVYPTRAMRQLFILQRETFHSLKRVRQPVLILEGRLDRSVHPSVPGMIAAGVSSSTIQIHWLEHSGHCLALDAEWEQAAKLMGRFLQRAGPSSS